MTYKVITSDESSELAETVNEHLRDGWLLQGGVSATLMFNSRNYSSEVYYAQAVVKEDHPES